MSEQRRHTVGIAFEVHGEMTTEEMEKIEKILDETHEKCSQVEPDDYDWEYYS